MDPTRVLPCEKCLSTKIAAGILTFNTPTTNDTENNDHEVRTAHEIAKSEKRTYLRDTRRELAAI
jgi:hypothetical protein